MIDSIRRDLLHALRSLRRTPAFTATAVLILGLGIGMTSAMFTVFQSVLLTRLPVVAQDRIVELSGVGGGAATEVPLLPARLRRYRTEARTVQAVAGLAHWRVIANPLTDGDRSIVLKQAVVTEEFFQVLGASPVLGRLFRPGDNRPWAVQSDDAALIVLSYDAWRRAFGGDSSVLGHQLREPKISWAMTVIGVAPPGLDYPRGVDYWLASEYGGLDVVARLAPGASVAAARNELDRFLAEDPDLIKAGGPGGVHAQAHTLEQMVMSDVTPALLVLSAAVGLLLLLACVNIGNLLLLRTAGRVRELAIRRAIGATSSDLVQQLLTESALLAAAGGVLGVGLARIFLVGIVRLAPDGLPRVDLITLAGTPVVIAAAVTISTVLLFGVFPSLAALRFDLSAPLHSSTRSGGGSTALRAIRQVLVASQIALAVVVLAGAGLPARSFARLTNLDFGYTTEQLALLSVSFPWKTWFDQCRPPARPLAFADSARWQRCSEESNFAGHDRVMAELRALPGVMSVSPVVAPPFLGSNVWMAKYIPEGQSESGATPWFGLDLVGPEYFHALNLPILRGRGFTEADRGGAERVAVVSEGVARRLWPNENPIGKRFHAPAEQLPESLITVVGVTPDFHFREHREATPTILRPYRQVYAQGYFVVRTRGALAASLAAIREAVVRSGAGVGFVSARSMDALIGPQLAAPRFDALLLSIFAVTAMVLAAIGLYGIMASSVSQQTRELGVRMALGAAPHMLRAMVLGQALRIATAGALAGLVGALVGTRLLTTLLYRVSPSDPATLAGVTTALLGVALLAAYVPARRATKIDPARALRAE